jgi:hypothetical protein
LYKFGFKQHSGINNSMAYIKPEVKAELFSIHKLNESFPGLMNRTQFKGHYKSAETLTPSQCFIKCLKSMRCGGASFTTDQNSLDNCFFFAPAKLINSHDCELSISYVKDSSMFASAQPALNLEKNSTNSTTNTTASANSVARSKFIFPETSLSGFYSVYQTGSMNECFDLCDNDLVCAAAAWLISPDQCRLFKFGFKRTSLDRNNNSVAYIKSDVLAELASLDKLNETFHHVKNNTQFVGFYKSIETLTPSECFVTCKKSMRCGGASFTTDQNSLDNCFLCAPGMITEVIGSKESECDYYWISYAKAG